MHKIKDYAFNLMKQCLKPINMVHNSPLLYLKKINKQSLPTMTCKQHVGTQGRITLGIPILAKRL